MVIARKSKSLSEEHIKSSTTSDNSLNPRINYIDNAKILVTYDGSCLNQEKVKVTFPYKAVLKLYIVSEINS